MRRVGADLRHYLGLDDNVIEISVTPNRADCLGIAGIAREVGLLNNLSVNAPNFTTSCGVHRPTLFRLRCSAQDRCPRYVGRVIRGVDVSRPSPLWLQEKLRRCGIRSIDAVVDVTNYLLLELGQPMHAFDLEQTARRNCGAHGRSGRISRIAGWPIIRLAPGHAGHCRS